jgi:hypothetical protein
MPAGGRRVNAAMRERGCMSPDAIWACFETCHSEPSEESIRAIAGRTDAGFFAALRMTGKSFYP